MEEKPWMVNYLRRYLGKEDVLAIKVGGLNEAFVRGKLVELNEEEGFAILVNVTDTDTLESCICLDDIVIAGNFTMDEVQRAMAEKRARERQAQGGDNPLMRLFGVRPPNSDPTDDA